MDVVFADSDVLEKRDGDSLLDLVAEGAVDDGGPQREFLTMCMQAIEQGVCFTGCGGCCG